MSFFGVRINGAPKVTGAPVTFNGVTIATNGNLTGWLVAAGQVSASGGVYPNGNTLGLIQSTANGMFSFTDASISTGAQMNFRLANFGQPLSTFAQTATITNGPRAANPIAWVEVQVNGSSGRVPVW